MPPRPSLPVRLGLVLGASALAIVAARWAARPHGDRRSNATIEIAPLGEDDGPAWRDDTHYVADPHTGFRLRRATTMAFDMGGLEDQAPIRVTTRTNADGLVRADDLPAELAGARVLVLGDSHTHGVVPLEHNLTAVLEGRLRAARGRDDVFVLNAGCGLYGLYQYALRAEQLLPRYRPHVLLVVVFTGNDFVDLERRDVPHLDDELEHRPALAAAPPETTSERLRALGLRREFEGLFWQGLNQGLYALRDPGAAERLLRKAERAVERTESLAAAQGTQVVWALLPAFPQLFAEQVAVQGELVREVVESGVLAGLHRGFREALERRGATVVDLEPVFAERGRLGDWAVDFHIWIGGHRLVAEAVAGTVRRLLGP